MTFDVRYLFISYQGIRIVPRVLLRPWLLHYLGNQGRLAHRCYQDLQESQMGQGLL